MPKLVSAGSLVVTLVLAAQLAFAEGRGIRQLRLADCVRIALQADSSLRVTRIEERSAELKVRAERGVFFPTLSSLFGFRRQTATTPYTYSDPDGLYSTTSLSYGLGLTGVLPIGSSYELTFSSDMILDSDLVSSVFNKQHANQLLFTISHPLLRGWRMGTTMSGLEVARADHAASQQTVAAAATSLMLKVVRAYWSLVEQRETERNARRLLADVEKLRGWVETRFRAGTGSPVDLIEAKTAVATRKEIHLRARQQVNEAETALLALLYRKDGMNGQLQQTLEPTDTPSLDADRRELATLAQQALRDRPEIRAAQHALKGARTAFAAADNNALPRLDLQLSAGLTSLAGTLRPCVDLSGNAIDCDPHPLQGGHGTAWKQVFGGEAPFVGLGLKLELPLSSDARQKDAHEARLAHQRAKEALRGVRIQVLMEIRDALNKVRLTHRRLETVTEGAALARKALEAVETQFKSGLARSYDVLRIQVTVAQSESAVAATMREYAVARAELDRAVGELPSRFGVRLK